MPRRWFSNGKFSLLVVCSSARGKKFSSALQETVACSCTMGPTRPDSIPLPATKPGHNTRTGDRAAQTQGLSVVMVSSCPRHLQQDGVLMVARRPAPASLLKPPLRNSLRSPFFLFLPTFKNFPSFQPVNPKIARVPGLPIPPTP